jgi:preprotein translocase subunit SecG
MLLYTVILVVHVLICIALVLVILSQSSKGGGLDATLGGAAMNVFGGSGASAFLRRWTQYLGLAFLASCLVLAFLVKNLKTTSNAAELQKKINTEAPVKK